METRDLPSGSQMLTLCRTTPSILGPCLGQMTKYTHYCFTEFGSVSKTEYAYFDDDNRTDHTLFRTDTKIYTLVRKESQNPYPVQWHVPL